MSFGHCIFRSSGCDVVGSLACFVVVVVGLLGVSLGCRVLVESGSFVVVSMHFCVVGVLGRWVGRGGGQLLVGWFVVGSFKIRAHRCWEVRSCSGHGCRGLGVRV